MGQGQLAKSFKNTTQKSSNNNYCVPECMSSEYKCNKGNCIPKERTCHGLPSCNWEDDEQASLCGKQTFVTVIALLIKYTFMAQF